MPNAANVPIGSNWLMMCEVSEAFFHTLNRTNARWFSLAEDQDHRLCQFDDERDQCRFFYTYHTENDQLVLRVQKTKSKLSLSFRMRDNVLFLSLSLVGCRRILSVRSTILIIVSSILAFGLFCLMIWRMLATLHDRREFAKFEQEREKAKWETVSDLPFRSTLLLNSRLCLGRQSFVSASDC